MTVWRRAASPTSCSLRHALLEEDQERLRNKSGANRLGFALLLKFFEVEVRFPEDAGEIPVPAVSYVAQQVRVPAEEWVAYDCAGAGDQAAPDGDPGRVRLP
ncbi:DUF4158 domain-containing protein [Streptomyces sp. NPDC002994]|uniref:DUF4158 domain-containing protein n=1 Tax=Streptomyces sp. NPDC002994 TaxID=3154441 RepID=UPI0033AB31C3